MINILLFFLILYLFMGFISYLWLEKTIKNITTKTEDDLDKWLNELKIEPERIAKIKWVRNLFIENPTYYYKQLLIFCLGWPRLLFYLFK